MRTMNIFKGLALAMLMPAMLLTTACSNEDDAINEKASQEVYKMPITVNVTRQGDAATRATYDKTNKTLSFSTGDQLFVEGTTSSYQYAGTLEWQSGGTFSGNLSVNGEYPGTVEQMLTNATSVKATLLPSGWEDYRFLSIDGTGYEAYLLTPYYEYAIAGDLAAAVEQFSLEQASSYSNGFTLAPQNAIVNCSVKVPVTAEYMEFKPFVESDQWYGSEVPIYYDYFSDNDEHHHINFAIAVKSRSGRWKLREYLGKFSEIDLGEKTFVAGHIYNYTNDPTGHALYDAAVGEIVCSDGKAYSAAYKNVLPDGVTALAKVVYVGSSTGASSPYTHGLALALEDVSSYPLTWKKSGDYDEGKTPEEWCSAWNTSKPVANASWMLPSRGQWETMKAIDDSPTYEVDLRDIFEAVGGTNLKSDGYWSSTYEGSAFYWEYSFYGGRWWTSEVSNDHYVRACLAF